MLTHTKCSGAVHHTHNPGRVGGKHDFEPTRQSDATDATPEPVALVKCKHETAMVLCSHATHTYVGGVSGALSLMLMSPPAVSVHV